MIKRYIQAHPISCIILVVVFMHLVVYQNGTEFFTGLAAAGVVFILEVLNG